MAPDRTPDPVAIALRVGQVFKALNIRYVAAGSLASSLHGEPRSTNDIDVVADLRASHLPALLAELGAEWIWSADVARDAIDAGGSFNLIHASTAVKVDVFIAGNDAFDQHRIASGLPMRISAGARSPEILVDTAEHTVLRKLEWFKRGGAVSDRQWRDVVNVLRVQGASIDNAELDRWAPRLGVVELLAAARREARD